MTFFLKTTGNKFHNKKTTYCGNKFDSKGEASYAEELDWRIKAGEIQGYERQVKIELKVNGVLICNYYCDFLVVDKHGAKEIHEYKGFLTKDFTIKWRLLDATKHELFPDGVELIMIKHKSYGRKKF